MLETKYLSRGKRCLLFFSFLISFLYLNFSIFSRVSANSAEQSDSLDYFMIGAPFDFVFSTSPYDRIEYTYGYLKGANCFIADDDGRDFLRFYFATYNGSNTTATILFDLTNISDSSTVGVKYSGNPNISYQFEYFSISEDLYLPLNSNSYPYNAYISYGSGFIPVTYDVRYFVPVYVANELVDVRIDSFSFSASKSGYVDLVPYDLIMERVGSDMFVGSSGIHYAWIDSINIKLNYDGIHNLNIYDTYGSVAMRAYNFTTIQNERLSDILHSSSSPALSFADVSWTDWLVSSVGSFMDFEIVPNLSLGGIFALLIGMSLFMIFLKTFAGG